MTTGYNGRTMTITWVSTVLTGVRVRGFTVNNEPVDITTDDDAGFRALLADPGTRSVDYDVAGITSDEILIAEMFTAIGSGAHKAVSIALPTGNGTVAGNGMVTNLNVNASHDGAVEFTCTILSSGTVTYTASV